LPRLSDHTVCCCRRTSNRLRLCPRANSVQVLPKPSRNIPTLYASTVERDDPQLAAGGGRFFTPTGQSGEHVGACAGEAGEVLKHIKVNYTWLEVVGLLTRNQRSSCWDRVRVSVAVPPLVKAATMPRQRSCADVRRFYCIEHSENVAPRIFLEVIQTLFGAAYSALSF
jgi:hypothetical protein